jgi:hypothetical protein
MSYREIKFRGKCQTTGEWFYGYLFKSDSGERTHIIKNHKGCLDIDPDTVGEFTGLRDKNEIEIYENDLIKCEKDIYEIIWNRGMFILKNIRSSVLGDTPLGPMLDIFDIEIIGNRYDNLELLRL